MAYRREKRYKTLSDRMFVFFKKFKMVILFGLIFLAILAVKYRVSLWDYLKTFFY